MEASQLAAIGAVLSGAGSFIAAVLGIRFGKRRAASECEERMKEMRKSFDLGLRMERRKQRRESAGA